MGVRFRGSTKPAYLYTSFLLPAEFDFAKFSFTDGISEYVLSELGLFLSP